ncbi:MAG: pilus assembly protein PilM [Planctomycetota bacterium]|nr:pilus assembly protein PilM [Planctomycetota bacterium]
MANVGLGVTIGRHSLRAVKLRKKGDQYVVTRVFADRLDDSTRGVAGRALDARGFRGSPAVVGLTGRDVIIRYTQVPPVPDWRLRTLMKFEVEEVSQQSGGDVSADYRALNLPDPEGIRDDDTILVALARNKYLSEITRSLESGGIKLGEGVPNSVALFNAFAANATYTEDETALLVNVGSENVDIAVQQGGELIFARNATPGGQAFTDAIAQAFNTSEGKAEKMKKTKGDVTPKGQAKYPDPTSEKVANAIMGVAGQMASMIQSTLMIARAQTRLPDLKIDRVLLAGGGASLKGLDLYLKQALDVPVEHFDPFQLCDTSGLQPDELEMIEKNPHEFTVAVGLAQNRVAAEAMALSVLPAALKRARDFATKGVFSVIAAAVMVGVLFVIYNGRTNAAAEFRDRGGAVTTKERKAKNDDKKMRKALAMAQEQEVKHRLLAELVQPGVLLSEVWAEVEGNISPYIYIDTVQLNVSSPTHTFTYYKPKNATKPASGYADTTRSRYRLRECNVRVKGRISHGQNASRIAGQFINACIANKRGLLVETVKPPREGKGGRDGTFEIDFFPGITLESAIEKGMPITLRSISLDDPQEPTAFLGFRADGVRVRVPVEEVKTRQRKELIKQLQQGQ